MQPALPYDVLADIVGHAEPMNYLTLCLASRDLRALTVPLLYRKVSFHYDQDTQTAIFLDTILGNEKLGPYVKSLRLQITGFTAPRVCAALVAMPCVEHLDVSSLSRAFSYDPIGTFDAVAGLTHLRSIDMRWADDLDQLVDALLDRFPPMKRICFDADENDIPSLARLITRSIQTLEYLALQDYPLDEFLEQDAPGLVWTRVQELNVTHLSSVAPARAFVNVRRLTVGLHPIFSNYVLRDEALFPHLEQLEFVMSGLPSPAADTSQRRRIGHLKALIELHSSELLKTMLSFDWRVLRSLFMDARATTSHANVLDVLSTVLEGCAALRYLGIDYGWDSTAPGSDPVDFMLSLSLRAELPHLRFVSFVTASFGWGTLGEDRLVHAEEELPGVAPDPTIAALFARFAQLRVAHVDAGDTPLIWQRNLETQRLFAIRASDVGSAFPASLAKIAQLADEPHASSYYQQLTSVSSAK